MTGFSTVETSLKYKFLDIVQVSLGKGLNALILLK